MTKQPKKIILKGLSLLLSMAKISLIYGTSGGNTQIVCEKVCEVLRATHSVVLIPAQKASQKDLLDADVIILASPTYEHGVLEEKMERFISRIQNIDLTGKKCTVIGLGDTIYEDDYCVASAKILMQFIKDKGGELVVAPLTILKSPIPLLETRIKTWAEQLSKKIS